MNKFKYYNRQIGGEPLEDTLYENRERGTFLFPFQEYKMTNVSGNLFVPYHWHKDIEILYIINGNLTLTINGLDYTLETGDIYFINKEDLHGITSSYDELLYYAFVFPLDILNFDIFDYSQSMYLTPLNNKELIFPTFLIPESASYQKIKNELDNILYMNENSITGYQLDTKVSLLKIISYFIQEGLFINPNKEFTSRNFLKIKQLRDIISYITEHYYEKIYLETIANEFHMSSKYFCKYFKNNFGKTFVEYLIHYRIERSCSLLQNTDISITELALNVGFDNISYFIKKFKEIKSYTPSEYRNNIRKGV